MKLKAVRTATVAFLLLVGFLAMWPGLLPFNRVRPLVLGLPFVMAWLTLLLLLVGVALWVLEVAERRAGTR